MVKRKGVLAVKCRFLTVAVPLIFGVAIFAQSPPTELRIHAVDESGQPLALSRAEIYLDLGGGGEKTAVLFDESEVRVPLDRSWLCGARPASCEDQFVEGRLLLHAEGYAPVVSRAFLWMGGVDTPGEAPRTSVDVRFVSGAWMHLEQSESRDLTLAFRRPQPRQLRFLNQTGEAVAGVGVRAYLLFAGSNHCGSTERELLAEGVSNEAGEVTIPDADAEYDFELTKAHHILINPQHPDDPMRAAAVLSQGLSAVLLRQLEKRPLHLQISGSDDLSGMELSACVAACPCGACCETLGESDATGRIDVDDFYPDEFERLTLLDRRGQPVWQGTPRTLDEADPILIQLPKTQPVLSAPVPLERPQRN
ncbi:MAG: hypothetical protein HY316_06385 [Acidobacteria bacterium]|nr:hypothetical protein [Acidobacteriota bacterium]